jgi:hypothetical protein
MGARQPQKHARAVRAGYAEPGDEVQDMSIQREVATVYRGGGRRWFSKKSACNAEARALIKKRCDCEKDDPSIGYSGETCHYHSDMNRYARIKKRLSRFIERKFDSSNSLGV